MKLWALVFLIGASFRVSATPAAAFVGSCRYYAALSTSLGCTEDGYLLSFGDPYCWMFALEEPLFSANGQHVLDRLRTCLEDSLESAPALTCANVADIAIDSHKACYLSSGFCTLNPIEQSLIATTILPSLSQQAIQKTVIEIGEQCLQQPSRTTVFHPKKEDL